MEEVALIKFSDYRLSISEALDFLRFNEKLCSIDKVIIKPNLLQDTPPPCTTDVECISAIVEYIIQHKEKIIITIIEGSGGCDTATAYRKLGFEALVSKYGVKLIDVDRTGLIKLTNKDALAYREIYLPEEAFGGFFISVPVLKDHLITTVTLGLKNLIGLLPERYYGSYWNYKRSDVHRVGVDKAIYDLNQYVKIDMSIIDGRIGQEGSHLAGGRSCKPEKNMILAGYDAIEVDKKGAEILGHDWQKVRHIVLCNVDSN